MIHVCSACGHRAQNIPEKLAGQVARCVKCGEMSTIAKPSPETFVAKPSPARMAEDSLEGPRVCRACGGDVRIDLRCPECQVAVCSERCLREHREHNHGVNRQRSEQAKHADGVLVVALMFGGAAFCMWPYVFAAFSILFGGLGVLLSPDRKPIGWLAVLTGLTALAAQLLFG